MSLSHWKNVVPLRRNGVLFNETLENSLNTIGQSITYISKFASILSIKRCHVVKETVVSFRLASKQARLKLVNVFWIRSGQRSDLAALHPLLEAAAGVTGQHGAQTHSPQSLLEKMLLTNVVNIHTHRILFDMRRLILCCTVLLTGRWAHTLNRSCVTCCGLVCEKTSKSLDKKNEHKAVKR